MSIKIIARLIALSALLARAWPWVSVRLSDFFVSTLGIAARLAIAFPACLLVFHLLKSLGTCFAIVLEPLDLLWCPLVTAIYLETEPSLGSDGNVPLQYLLVAVVALAIVAVWAANDRRRRQGRG